MDAATDQDDPWWKTATIIVVSIVGFFGGLLSLSPLWSEPTTKWYEDHGTLGWILVGALVLSASIVVGVQRQRHRKALRRVAYEARAQATRQNRYRAQECAADVSVAETQIGSLMSGADIRRKLESLPSSKDFARDLSRAFEQLERDLQDRSTVIFDAELGRELKQLKSTFLAYWCPLEEVLDAPSEIQDTRWDLRIIRPPGGPWSGDTESERWDSFYVFVRSLHPLQTAFLTSVDRVDARLQRLRVEATSSGQA